MKLPNWNYKNKELMSIRDINPDIYGFIYKIEFSDDSMYIGKKSFYNFLTKQKTKKEISSQDGRCSKKKVIRKESNWLNYIGSIKDLDFKESIKLNKIFVIKREILEFSNSKALLTYLEVKHQVLNSVLENQKYRNNNILGKFYRKMFGE